MIWDQIGSVVAIIVTLATMSVTLYKDNPSGEIAQRFFMVGSWATFMILALTKIYTIGIKPLLGGDIIKIIPIALGLLFVTLYYKPTRHLSRLPTAIICGVSMGLAFRGLVDTQLIGQVKASIIPVVGVDQGTAIQNIWIILTTVLTIAYFTFSFGLKEGTPVYYIRRLGRYTIMMLFGASLGLAPWSGTALIAGRFIWLINKITGLM